MRLIFDICLAERDLDQNPSARHFSLTWGRAAPEEQTQPANEARAVSVTSTHCPLTTTNSTKELTWLRPLLNDVRRAPERQSLRETASRTDYGIVQPPTAFMPWMQVADIWPHRAGFMSGQRMHFAFDYRNRCLTISPWRD